jgi:hypothetical protein
MFNQELKKRRLEIAKTKEKRIEGSVKIANCMFKNNCLSPYLPGIPDSLQATVEPWFLKIVG